MRYFKMIPAALADLLQTRLTARFGLLVTGGLGSSRLFATLAADTARPGTVRVLPDDPERQLAFLHRQDVRPLPGIGPVPRDAPAAVQLTLDRPTENARALEPVIDRANALFGSGTLAPAALVAAGGHQPLLRTARRGPTRRP
ncbi:hypothetical protein [Kitasatospora sp. NPDC088783]|uniref:hypothetical protein n=1 Tax=Kitasatospora sp. NPDC088783 TaxID=3364077 RepID=UPI0037F615EC